MGDAGAVVFRVLYTNQKQKKTKTWHDGCLRVDSTGARAVLCDEAGATLDSCFLKGRAVAEGEQLETERYLVEIDARIGVHGADARNKSAAVAPCAPQSVRANPVPFRSVRPTTIVRDPVREDVVHDPRQTADTILRASVATNGMSSFVSKRVGTTVDANALECAALRDLCGSPAQAFAPRPVANVSGAFKPPRRSVTQLIELLSAPARDMFDAHPTPFADDCAENFPPEHAGWGIQVEAARLAQAPLLGQNAFGSSALSRRGQFAGPGRERPPAQPHPPPTTNEREVRPFVPPVVRAPVHEQSSVCDEYIGGDWADEHDGAAQGRKEPLSARRSPVGFFDGDAPNGRAANEYGPATNATNGRDMRAVVKSGFGTAVRSAAHPKVGSLPLSFPSGAECAQKPPDKRRGSIAVSFDSVREYRQNLEAVLVEHLNVSLGSLAHRYHRLLAQVEIAFGEGKTTSHDKAVAPSGPACKHGATRVAAVKKDGPNKGRLFYACPAPKENSCRFFQWADEWKGGGGPQATGAGTGVRSAKSRIGTQRDLEQLCKTQTIALYCGCELTRKEFGGKFGKGGKGGGYKKYAAAADSERGSLYLTISRKERSSAYSKDDLWIISDTPYFEPNATMIARSTFFGPSSDLDVEVAHVAGCGPGALMGSAVYAIHAGDAAAELGAIENIRASVCDGLPILPYLLQGSRPHRGNLGCHPYASSLRLLSTSGDREAMAAEFCSRFGLNDDQARALRACGEMFSANDEGAARRAPLLLIHGVFGAGKSRLLSVVVMFLVQLIEAGLGGDVSRGSKILISSNTNVAVDRVLQGLVEAGFERFVRVGSVRKIAKQILPHSVHSSSSASQDLRDLRDMLKEELSPTEKAYVRKSIERIQRGDRAKRLEEAPVIGVTCSATVFPCLDTLQFPIVVLDECSQMTEPTSLLPVARFGCEKLVLVGDPKQLSPTIADSEAEHANGLERTLFERLALCDAEPILLRMQYRCHPLISQLPNALFYGGQLHDGCDDADRAPLDPRLPTLAFFDVQSAVGEQQGPDGSYMNDAEADFVTHIARVVCAMGVPATDVGIVCLYRSQVVSVQQRLRAVQDGSDVESVFVSTVDAFQGGEKEVIILSCVRTKQVGFADSERRINVALTRARRHLYIAGSASTLTRNAMWRSIIEACKVCPSGFERSSAFVQRTPLDSIRPLTPPEASTADDSAIVPHLGADDPNDAGFFEAGSNAVSGRGKRRVHVHSDEESLSAAETQQQPPKRLKRAHAQSIVSDDENEMVGVGRSVASVGDDRGGRMRRAAPGVAATVFTDDAFRRSSQDDDDLMAPVFDKE